MLNRHQTIASAFLSLATWIIYLHVTKDCSNVIGQYYLDYKWTTNRIQNASNSKILFLALGDVAGCIL